MPESLESLEAQRTRILSELAQSGDMRRGSITLVYRRCGKNPCCCEQPDHPGHGPYYAFTTKVDGKTQTLQLRPGPRLDKIQKEVETYRRFRERCEQLVSVNEKICQARPIEGALQSSERLALKKKSYRLSRRRLRGK